MLIKLCKINDIPSREITPRELYLERRRFMQAGVSAFAGLALGGCEAGSGDLGLLGTAEGKSAPLTAKDLTPPGACVPATTISSNWDRENRLRHVMRTRSSPAPGRCGWTVSAKRPGEIGIEDILKDFPAEERIYRLRCVEAWAMVIPWEGFPLSKLLQRFKPTSRARYVAFETHQGSEDAAASRQAGAL